MPHKLLLSSMLRHNLLLRNSGHRNRGNSRHLHSSINSRHLHSSINSRHLRNSTSRHHVRMSKDTNSLKNEVIRKATDRVDRVDRVDREMKRNMDREEAGNGTST